MGLLVLVVYILFAGAIAWSAVRHQGPGWISGFIIAILMATIPLWVIGGYYLYQALAPQP